MQREDVNAIVYWDRGPVWRQRGTNEDFISGSWSRCRGKSLRGSFLSLNPRGATADLHKISYRLRQIGSQLTSTRIEIIGFLDFSFLNHLTCKKVCCEYADSFRSSFSLLNLSVAQYSISLVKNSLNFTKKRKWLNSSWIIYRKWEGRIGMNFIDYWSQLRACLHSCYEWYKYIEIRNSISVRIVNRRLQ